MKNKLSLVLIVSAFFCMSGCSFMVKQAVQKLENHPVNMNEVNDGIYTGKSDAGPVHVEVEVTVKDSSIIKVNILKHQNGLGKSAEVITEKIEKMNTWNVDAVSGATVSSEAIKNAVNKALYEGMQKK